MVSIMLEEVVSGFTATEDGKPLEPAQRACAETFIHLAGFQPADLDDSRLGL